MKTAGNGAQEEERQRKWWLDYNEKARKDDEDNEWNRREKVNADSEAQKNAPPSTSVGDNRAAEAVERARR